MMECWYHIDALTTESVYPPCNANLYDQEEKMPVESGSNEKPSSSSFSKLSRKDRACIQTCAAYGKVCPSVARIAANSACDAIKRLIENSRVFTKEPDFTYLNEEDIVIEEILGEGGFCNVNKCIVTTGADAGREFAIKSLKRKAMVDAHHFKHGAADLVVEAYFLQTLSHENIITIHGFTAGYVEKIVSSGKECGLFIVIDRLFDTLEHRIEKWAQLQKHHSGNLLTRWTSEHKERKMKEMMERVGAAYMIGNAMEYLHGKDIIFRDLKPANAGFDENGVLKLFDMGLACELKREEAQEDGTYKLTGNTGSRRYMAPEVAKEEPYGKPVDVYSFGILLWECCAAEKPFCGYSSGMHMHKVVLRGERPNMDQNNAVYWPESLKWLMKSCWSVSPSARPSFTVIKEVLGDILAGKETVQGTVLLQKPDSLRLPAKSAATYPRRTRTWSFSLRH